MRTLFLLMCITILTMPSIQAAQPLITYIKKANPKVTSWEATAIVANVLRYSIQRKLDPLLVLAIIEVESTFNPSAASRNPKKPSQKWSIGLMQINKYAWLYKKHAHNLLKAGIIKSEKDLYNIALNVKAGTFIFAKTQEYCNKWKKMNRLKSKRYKSVFQCSIASYNGSTTRFEYYNKVMVAFNSIKATTILSYSAKEPEYQKIPKQKSLINTLVTSINSPYTFLMYN